MKMKRVIGLSLGIVIGGSVIGWLVYRYEPFLQKQIRTLKPYFVKAKAGTKGSLSGCSSCDVLITSNQVNLTVNSGQTVCIASGVTVSGDIIVNGTLCNQGTVNASNFNVGNNATIYNYGDMNLSSNLILNSSAEFYNDGDLNIDGSIILNTNSSFVNTGDIEVDDNVIINNNASFSNQGELKVERNMYVNGNGNVTNTGEIDIEENLYVNGDFKNNGTVSVDGDFTINGPGSFFSSDGMVGCITVKGNSIINGCLGCNDNPLHFCDQTSTSGGQPDLVNGSADIGDNMIYCDPTVNCGQPLPTSIQLMSQQKSPTTILLTWTPVPNALLYNIEYASAPNFESPTSLTTLSNTSPTSYEVNLKELPSLVLYFRIVAQLQDGNSLSSNIIEVNPVLSEKVAFRYVHGSLQFSNCLKEIRILDLSGKEIFHKQNVCNQISINLTPNQIYVITYIDKNGNPGHLKMNVIPG